jgi:DNA-binding GntR family transcriptional regulator
MGSLMRSSLDRQGGDFTSVVLRHRVLVDALRSRRRPTIERAIREHYIDPTTLYLSEEPAQ